MWNVAITYEDPSNFLTDKALFSAAIASVVNYLNKFIVGSTTLNLTVSVSQTSTGRFAGNGAVALDHAENGLYYMTSEAAKELAAGANLNGSAADLTVYVDPTSSYFHSLYFTASAYDGPRTVPSNATDGLSVLLHEMMHGLGVNSYRDASGQFTNAYRMLWDAYTTRSGDKLLLDAPELAAHGIDPLQVSSTSATQNNSHLVDATDLQKGYADDLMNGMYFYLGHQYAMSQVDVLLLDALGFTVTMPDTLKLSDGSLTGKNLVLPTIAAGAPATGMSGNALHLSGTALAGSTTSILEHGKLLAQTKADAAGHWSLDLLVDPALAASTLVVRDGTHVLDGVPLATSRDTGAGLHLAGSEVYANMVGGAYDDVFTPGPRGGSIDGGAGFDKVEYAQTRAANTIARQADGSFKVGDGAGFDILSGIERIAFSDAFVALDVGIDGVAGQAYRLYQAAFDRSPDAAGLGFWINAMDHGIGLLDIARAFVQTAEFRQLYGSQPSNADIVTRYYQNVLHRAPDSGGFDFWLDAMAHKGVSAADVLANFSQSAENVAALTGVMQNGVGYVWHG